MYKQGQGIASRSGIAVLAVLIAMYASYSWYSWTVQANVGASQTAWQMLGESLTTKAFIGAVILLLGITAMGLYTAFVNARTSDYLIDMDVELKKVVWPTLMPLFNPKTEAWGSTYIVIVCTVILAVFTGVVDKILNLVISQGLLTWILS